MAGKRTVQAQQELLHELIGRQAELTPFGPRTGGYALGRLRGYPDEGRTTLMTFGLADHPASMYRGLPLGHELVLTGVGDTREHAHSLRSAVLEDRRARRDDDRRPVVAAEQVWAPGHPPHLLFTSRATCTPELLVRKQVGDRYVSVLAAVPLDDRELREYDRSPGDLADELQRCEDLAVWPRPTP